MGMALATGARYTGSTLDAALGIAILASAAFHVLAGVTLVVLPAVGGIALLAAVVAIAPVTRRYVRRNQRRGGDLVVFAGGIVAGCLSMGVFFASGVAV